MKKKKKSEACYCGSGLVFKSCCKGKINSCKQIYGDDILKNSNRVNHILEEKMRETDYKICLHPEHNQCKLPIKNAHTLQNNGILSVIAEKDHVMVTNLFNKVRNSSVIQKVSKNKATTFYGFCEYHDSIVFKDIETAEYKNKNNQNFLYAYRACAQEFHKKTRAMKAIQRSFKENPGIYYIPEFISNYELQELAYLDVEKYMKVFNNSFINNNLDILENYVLEFDEAYDFAVTTMFNPVYDLEGNQINNIYSMEKENLKSIFLSVIPIKNTSYMIISCLKNEYKYFEQYFNQIKELSQQEIKIFLNNILPTFSENIVLSPRLWEKWTPFSQRQFEKVITGGIGEFDKLISGELPYESLDEFESGMEIKNGVNDMMKTSKYNLFKK